MVAALVWTRESERVGGTAVWMVGSWAVVMALPLVALMVAMMAVKLALSMVATTVATWAFWMETTTAVSRVVATVGSSAIDWVAMWADELAACLVDSRAEMMGYPWAEPKVAQSVACSVYWSAAEMDAMLAGAMVDCLVCWRTAELMGVEMVGRWKSSFGG